MSAGRKMGNTTPLVTNGPLFQEENKNKLAAGQLKKRQFLGFWIFLEYS